MVGLKRHVIGLWGEACDVRTVVCIVTEVGDSVKEDDVIGEIETDKVSVP